LSYSREVCAQHASQGKESNSYKAVHPVLKISGGQHSLFIEKTQFITYPDLMGS
jgi:hypothetical protein